MRQVNLIGIGSGDLDDMTVKAVEALNRSDVLFFPVKERDGGDLRQYRYQICERYLQETRPRIVEIPDPQRESGSPQYEASVQSWYDQRVIAWEAALGEHLGADDAGAFLVWGDPSLYDGTLRVLQAIRAREKVDFEIEIIPGISAVQSLVARHQITLNRVGGSVLITTGRELAGVWAEGIEDVVVMLDPYCSFAEIDDHTTTIYWGAYIGTPNEILISGTIEECGETIKRARAEAKDRHGWVFDTYLLRRARPN